jgi:glycosyltransferase involved in cell wall biosynthesis
MSPDVEHEIDFDIVIPTVGRETLETLLRSIERQRYRPTRVRVVQDVERRGPAWARNAGWRSCDSEWIVFLDDDVLLTDRWSEQLMQDLNTAHAGVQGRISVPLPTDHHPTDDERMTIGLQYARWATADMAYRREALDAVGGFDETFPSAFREDSDLALRVIAMGGSLGQGDRVTIHPPREDPWWASVRRQRGNADDVYMRRRHGDGWRQMAGAPSGRLRLHRLTVITAAAGVGAAMTEHPRIAGACALAWAGLTGEFAARRIAAGPRPGEPGWISEWMKMLVTSAAIPFVAVQHEARGRWMYRRVDPFTPAVSRLRETDVEL